MGDPAAGLSELPPEALLLSLWSMTLLRHEYRRKLCVCERRTHVEALSPTERQPWPFFPHDTARSSYLVRHSCVSCDRWVGQESRPKD